MVFSSILFLTRFLPLVLLIYFAVPKKARNLVLFVASLIFYAWGEPKYLFLMLFTIMTDYVFALFISKSQKKENEGKTRAFLVAAVVINLALLGFFKYADFTINTVNSITKAGLDPLKIALPIGISFYTFQSLSYVIDVYRGDVAAEINPLVFGTYVTLFPQLIAGPIVRYRTVAEEMRSRKENIDDFSSGIDRFIMGLGKKVLLANNAGLLWDTVKALPAGETTVATAWIGIIAYSFQIYFDFSGYSDMAIGMGRMFGFHFDENFNYPYIADSITDFWRRWHISLSTWFKEYVYIPLGGNRKGFPKQIRNIFIVWLLTGFWHGAAWNFVAWGLFYGVILIIEKLFTLKWLGKMPAVLRHIYTLIIVMVGWVLFAFDDFSMAFKYLGHMFGVAVNGFADETTMYLFGENILLLLILLIASTPLPALAVKKIFVRIGSKQEGAADKNEGVSGIVRLTATVCFLGTVFVLSFSYLVASTYNPFLYFRF
jgi:alginate O-acetyltransferase complex protein AlgI